MTKNTYGNKAQNLDTRLFRSSISVYIKHIHGLRDDDFLYEHVNKTLSVQQKIYIKKVGCSPQTVTLQDFNDVSQILSMSERCHICLIVMETKREIELTYLARAALHYLN
jgi:hypothetical protein